MPRMPTALLTRWLSATVLVIVALGPMIALAAAPLLGGDGGGPRSALVELALVLADRATWEALRNSLLVSCATMVGSTVLGILLGWTAGRRRFPGASGLLSLGLAAGLVPPLIGALGYLGLITWLGPGGDAWAWIGLTALAIVPGSARIAVAVFGVVRSHPTSWEDAARQAGARPARVWRSLWLPLSKPRIVAALAQTFTLTLVEPAAPYVLGLRRTLGYQLLEAASNRLTYPRAAVLGWIAASVVLLARAGLRWWCRPDAVTVNPGVDRRRAAGRGRALSGVAGLILWLIVAWLPIAGLVLLVRADPRSGPAAGSSTSSWRDAGEVWSLIGNSLTLGLIVALSAALLSRLASFAPPRVIRLLGLARIVPPAVLAMGGLMLPICLLRLAETTITFGPSLTWLSEVLTPPLLTALVLTAMQLATTGAGTSLALRVRDRRLADAASTLGAGRARSVWDVASPQLMSRHAGPLLRSVIKAATESAATLVILSPGNPRFFAPGLLNMLDQPVGLSRGAIVALGAVIVLVAVHLGSIRDEFWNHD